MFEPRVGLSMGNKIIEIPNEKKDFGGQWGSGKFGFADFEPRVDLGMGKKSIGFPKEN